MNKIIKKAVILICFMFIVIISCGCEKRQMAECACCGEYKNCYAVQAVKIGKESEKTDIEYICSKDCETTLNTLLTIRGYKLIKVK